MQEFEKPARPLYNTIWVKEMIETKDLIIKKAVFEDWPDIYRNVWSHPECAKHMLWSVTTSEEDAKARMLRTLKWEAEHDSYFIFEKASGQAIGFTGVEPVTGDPADGSAMRPGGVWEEAGICIGTDFWRRGYGRQVAQALMDYVREKYGAREFQVSVREANTASRKMADSFGLTLHHTEQRTDERDGSSYTMLVFRKSLQAPGTLPEKP